MSEGEERRDALIGEEEQKDRMKERAKRCTNRGRRAEGKDKEMLS